MGGKESKPISIPYEEAIKRVNEAELTRLKDAFKRAATNNGTITKISFLKDVLGDAASAQLGELIFNACGGNYKGINFKDLLCCLVLLTRGNEDEKTKFIFGIYCNENDSHVVRSEMVNQVKATENEYNESSLKNLFAASEKVTFNEFKSWILRNRDATTISRWVLDTESTASLSNEIQTPTFYQTLAGVTHLEETEILELEKRYWNLKGLSPSGKLDCETLVPMMSPLSQVVANGVFKALDENMDNHIDFKEMACGISAACRGPETERQKFCFKVFDMDKDNKLNERELFVMCQSLIQLYDDEKETADDGITIALSKKSPYDICCGVETIRVNNLMQKISNEASDEITVTLDQFLIWALNDSLINTFLDVLFQVCHIVLGLKPRCASEEGDIVLKWLLRAEKKCLTVGQFWYIVNTDWWNSWLTYIASCKKELSRANTPTSPLLVKKSKLSKISADGCVATDNNNTVIGTSFSTINHDARDKMGSSDSLRSHSKALESGPSFQTGLSRTLSSLSEHSRTASCSSMNLSIPPAESRSSSPSKSPNTQRRPCENSDILRPSAIDNSNLIETPSNKVTQLTCEGGRLKRQIIQDRDYILAPDSLWRVLQRWYGGGPGLPRQVIYGKGAGARIDLELYPITLKLLRHAQVSSRANNFVNNGTNVTYGLGGLSNYGATISKIADSTQMYVSSIPSLNNTLPKRYLAYMATFSRLSTLRQVYDFLSSKLRLRKDDFRLWMLRDEPAGMTLLEDENQTLEESGVFDLTQILVEIRNKDLSWPEEMSQLNCRTASGYSIRGSKNVEKGMTGLNNLGNTCFLNAALQCCSNTVPLTAYFIRDMHLFELNIDNPCGMKGHVALQYGALMKEIWNGEAKTVAPLKLRWTIGKYSANFTTFQQHDSQELLAFLLDGLHEDLNRVHNKPYTELRDSDGRPDTLVAQEAWENHILRNKSVIVDLFHGQLKSKVTCSICGNESARFDPFSYLTLQLPMESYIYLEVVVLRLDGTLPVKYGIRLTSDSRFRDVKKQLSLMSDISSNYFMLVELCGAQFKAFINDEVKIRGSSTGIYFAYELPHRNGLVENGLSNDSLPRNPKDKNILSSIQRSAFKSSPCIKMASEAHTLSSSNGTSTDTDVVDSKNKELELNTLLKSSKNVRIENGNGEICDSRCSKDVTHIKTCDRQFNRTLSLNNDKDSLSSLESYQNKSNVPDYRNSSSSAPNSLLQVDRSGVDYAEKGFVLAFHRKMLRQELYFLTSQKSKPSLFGLPLVIPCQSGLTSNQSLYESVWTQVSRLVSPLPPTETGVSNHAQDCDDSLGYEFPFVLKTINRNGDYCSSCPWYKFCRGCQIPCDANLYSGHGHYLAIDWDPTALHLRYQSCLEKDFQEDKSVKEMQKKHKEPIALQHCLEAFCSDETLEYSCDNCKKVQHATKKLQIWRLPPVLIVHLKRFQFVNNKWVKTQKIVDFPLYNFDPTDYLASVPRQTILLHKAELQGIDENAYVKGLQEKDNVFLKRVPENQIMEENTPVHTFKNSSPHRVNFSPKYENHSPKLHSNSTSTSSFQGNCPKLHSNLTNTSNFQDNGSKLELPNENDQNLTLKRQRNRNGSILYGDTLQDFHQHRLKEGCDPLELKYNLYAVACHSGILDGGHYVCYAKNSHGKWICFNDSSCKEVPEAELDLQSSYLLFYEREGLSYENYMPNVEGKSKVISASDLESDEMKKQCIVM